MMFTMAFEANATQHDHLVIAFGLVEGFLQDRDGILSVAGEGFLQRSSYASGSLYQAVTLRIVARPSKDGLHRGFDFGPVGPGGMAVHGPYRLESAHIGTHGDILLSPGARRGPLL